MVVMVAPDRPGGRVRSQQSIARSVVESTLRGLFTVGRENNLPDPGVERGHVAECAGFAGGDQESTIEPGAPAVTAGIANGDHLRVGRRVPILIHPVHTAAQYISPMIGYQGGKRNSALAHPAGRKRYGLPDKLIEQGLVDCCAHQSVTFLKTCPEKGTRF